MTGIIEGMVFAPSFKPFGLVMSPAVYDEEDKDNLKPTQNVALTQIEIKTTRELSELVRLEELWKTQGGGTEEGRKEWNVYFEKVSKEGGFQSFVFPWEDQMLMHIMKQIGLVRLPDEVSPLKRGDKVEIIHDLGQGFRTGMVAEVTCVHKGGSFVLQHVEGETPELQCSTVLFEKNDLKGIKVIGNEGEEEKQPSVKTEPIVIEGREEPPEDA